MGGLAFVCAALIVCLCFCGVRSATVNLALVIIAGYCLVGFLDDFLKIYRKDNLGLRPYQKIIFQCAIAAIAAAYCYVNGLTEINIPFAGMPVDVSWGIIPLVVLAFLSTVNCVNLTDGLDGLAGGTTLACLASFGLLIISSSGGLSYLQYKPRVCVHGRYRISRSRRGRRLRFCIFRQRAVYPRYRHNVRYFGNICNSPGNIL